MNEIDAILLRFFNGCAGRSWWFDSVVALAIANDLIKSAPIGGCFFAAWYGRGALANPRVRRVLLLTLIAGVCTLATTTAISHVTLVPRPYLRAHKVYELRQTELRELPRLATRSGLDNRSRQRDADSDVGNIPPNDLRAFPSDHAGFFFCISLGICLAAPRIGAAAMAWTLLLILGGKMVTGMHAPSDIAVGCLVGAAWLALWWKACWTRLDAISERIVAIANRRPGLSAAILFIALFEIASTFDHVKALASAVAKHV